LTNGLFTAIIPLGVIKSMKEYFKNLSLEQKQQLFNTLNFKTYPYGFQQGTTTLSMKDGSVLYYSYNHSLEYSKAAFFKDFDIRISTNAKKKLFDEIPLNKANVIKYFKFMLDVYGKDYYLYATVHWNKNDKMLALLYRAHKGLTEKELQAMM